MCAKKLQKAEKATNALLVLGLCYKNRNMKTQLPSKVTFKEHTIDIRFPVILLIGVVRSKLHHQVVLPTGSKRCRSGGLHNILVCSPCLKTRAMNM